MSEETQLCTFTIAHLLCGVPVLDVQEVLREREMTPVPLADKSVKGLLNLRGEVVTAIDLRICLGLPERAVDEAAAHVIIRDEDECVSLLVDAVEDVLTLSSATFEPPPQTLHGPARAYITGVYKLDERLLLVLDAKAIAQADGSE